MGSVISFSRQIDELLESKRNKIVLVAEPAVDFWVPLEAHLGAFEGFQVAFGHPSFLVVVGELLKLILSCLKNKRHADQYIIFRSQASIKNLEFSKI